MALGLQRLGLPGGRTLFAPLHRRTGGSLRLLASGGAPLDAALEQRLRAFGWQVAVGYGLTETAPLLALRGPEAKASGVGRPLAGVELRISDDDVPEGSDSGEVQVRGPNVFGGYLNLPDKTAEAFTADGWFRTGDLGRLDEDGRLSLAGRATEMIVTEGGENVQPENVEDAYLEHPALREIGIFEKDDRLVALVVPQPKALRTAGDAGKLVGDALRERAKKLPSYLRVTDFAVTRESLPRTRLGKLRRHELPPRFDKAKRGDERPARPAELSEMSSDDRTLLQHPHAKAVWDYLTERYARQPLTPDSALGLDLGVDSLDWVNLTLEIARRTRTELSESQIAEFDTVRDLLQAVAQAGEGEKLDLRGNPEQALDEDQKRWLRELPRASRTLSMLLYGVTRFTMRTLFRLQVEGRSNLEAADGALVFAPNHVSLLDPFALAAAVGGERVRNLYWGGWVGLAFRNPLVRAGSRLAQSLPVDPERSPVSSLAFGAAVLKRGKHLVWFPEGERSQDGHLQDLKPGIAMLLEAQDAQVVPVYISGSHEALPVGRWLPRRRRICVRFGRPIKRSTLLREGEGENPRDKVLHSLGRRIESLAAA